MEDEAASQARYRCRLAWGPDGVGPAVQSGDILVVVDALRFSTAAVSAVHHGVVIYPCAPGPQANVLAAQVGGELALYGRSSRFSLSPSSYEGAQRGMRVVLPSPNGAVCSQAGRALPHVFVGALINAHAVADAVETVLEGSALSVTVLACGERYHTAKKEQGLRFAIEDYLGAGAIVAGLTHDKSPEAQLCEAAFRSSRERLAELMWDCTSGWELREKGFGDDVRLAASLDLYDTVPAMAGDHLVVFRG